MLTGCKKASIAAILLLLFLHLHLLWLPTFAQGGIKVWPTKMELTVDRGETVERSVNLENKSGDSARLRVYAMDFSIDKENNFTFSEPGHESYSCASWLNIEEADFELGPGESRKVKVVVSVPQEVEPGGHYAALFFETIPAEAEAGVSVTISSRIASLVYLTVPGVTEADILAEAEIVSLLSPGWVEKGPVEIGVLVRNTGNVHLEIAAKAHLSGSRSGEIGELDLGQTVVLPHSERIMKGKWEKTPFFDKVTANVVVGYFDQQGELVNKSATARFWVIPWRIITAVAASFVLLALLIWRLRRRYRLRLERK